MFAWKLLHLVRGTRCCIMDKKDDAFMSAFGAAAVEMAHESRLLGTVTLSESFGVSLQNSPHKRMHGLSLSTPVLRDFQNDDFENSDVLLDIDKFNQANSQNFQRDWKLKDNSEAAFGKPAEELRNGGAVQSGQSQFRHEMDRYDHIDVPPEKIDRSQTRTLRISANTTRIGINNDLKGRQFDPTDDEDISLVKHEVSALDRTSSEPVLCSVCGDTVAGFHCGAYVCEACKVSTDLISAGGSLIKFNFNGLKKTYLHCTRWHKKARLY